MIVPFTANRCKKRINQSIQFGQFSTIRKDLDSLSITDSQIYIQYNKLKEEENKIVFGRHQ
jgi:hypothetical protein